MLRCDHTTYLPPLCRRPPCTRRLTDTEILEKGKNKPCRCECVYGWFVRYSTRDNTCYSTPPYSTAALQHKKQHTTTHATHNTERQSKPHVSPPFSSLLTPHLTALEPFPPHRNKQPINVNESSLLTSPPSNLFSITSRTVAPSSVEIALLNSSSMWNTLSRILH